ncbi:MAG TPA: polysaccharide deacetylase family protein, partial [Oscillospiraceae bacterium]|nr:polysaccharide deacetylase family protein [Oscillospiraceae bacterium]
MRKKGRVGPLLLFLLTALALLLPRTAESVETGAAADVPDAGLLALTFDDGPRSDTTTVLLDGLGERCVTATFFLLGEKVEGREEIVRRMAREGYEVGIHGNGHLDLTRLTPARLRQELGCARSLLSPLTGQTRFLVRPPYGFYNACVQKYACAPLIRWSLDTLDWEDKNVDRIVAYLSENARDGDIILMHDVYPESVEAALRAVEVL